MEYPFVKSVEVYFKANANFFVPSFGSNVIQYIQRAASRA